ncbi:cache domain-containing protein [Desulfonatronovibrio magnus]|uniref:cache domain-containing protein n=1 Tax=Desulfonatronovibrio magnus TaxID=698827 RepID=UPI0005EB3E7F|nr:cache domain-containing protein [Desulfonatronovibrio magnus]RQD56920.1 MAG: hypothetical protein D5R98_09345 [Desulfonatronovibrio sp. MSAO_Bac4]
MPAKIILLISILFFLFGCDRFDQLQSKMRVFEIGATEYEIETNRKDVSALEKSLATNIYPIDTQMTRLLRDLSVRDSFPPPEWMAGMMNRYFWLNGISIIDADQNILFRYPSVSIKDLSFSPAFPQALDLRQGRVMLAIEESELGKEVLLISSVYENFEIAGFIVVHFDPRTFIAQSNRPEDIILITDQEIAWTGQFENITPLLQPIDWQDKLTRRISGKISLEHDQFFWFARAVGEDWLIYLIQDN